MKKKLEQSNDSSDLNEYIYDGMRDEYESSTILSKMGNKKKGKNVKEVDYSDFSEENWEAHDVILNWCT